MICGATPAPAKQFRRHKPKYKEGVKDSSILEPSVGQGTGPDGLSQPYLYILCEDVCSVETRETMMMRTTIILVVTAMLLTVLGTGCNKKSKPTAEKAKVVKVVADPTKPVAEPLEVREPTAVNPSADGGDEDAPFNNRSTASRALFLASLVADDCRSAKLGVYKTLTRGTVVKSSPIRELGGEYTMRYIEGSGGFSVADAQEIWEGLKADQSMSSLNSEHPLWALSASIIREKATVHERVPFFLSKDRRDYTDLYDPEYRWSAPSNKACREALRKMASRIIAQCDSGSTRSVNWIRYAASVECGIDPETPAGSECGSPFSLAVTKDASSLPQWPLYACRGQQSAGKRWSECLEFKAYNKSTEEDYNAKFRACPGRKRCCPPLSAARELDDNLASPNAAESKALVAKRNANRSDPTTPDSSPSGRTAKKTVRITPRHLVGLGLEKLKSLCDNKHDGEACLEAALRYKDGPNLGPDPRTGIDIKLVLSMAYIAGGCKFGSGQACSLLSLFADGETTEDKQTQAKARRLLYQECLAGRDDSCSILSTLLRRTLPAESLTSFIDAAKDVCEKKGKACVLARELSGNRTSLATDCGTQRAIDWVLRNGEIIEMTDLAVPAWDRWTCQAQGEAGTQWRHCLARSQYSGQKGAGCPGEEQCCPPQDVDMDNFAE